MRNEKFQLKSVKIEQQTLIARMQSMKFHVFNVQYASIVLIANLHEQHQRELYWKSKIVVVECVEQSSFIKQFAALFDCLKDILIVNNENGMTKNCH